MLAVSTLRVVSLIVEWDLHTECIKIHVILMNVTQFEMIEWENPVVERDNVTTGLTSPRRRYSRLPSGRKCITP